MTYDASFKDIFGSIVREKNLLVFSSVKVGKLPLEIDMVLERRSNTDFSLVLPLKRIFEESEANRLIVEFKSKAEGLSISHVRRLIAYRQLYLMTEDQWDAKGTSHLIFMVSTPRKLLKRLDAQTLSQGIYRFVFDRNDMFMIVANDLPISRETLGLAIFTNSIRKSRELIDLLLQNPAEERFLSFFMVVNYGTTIKVLKEKGMSSGSIIMKNIRMAINDLGLANVIREIGLENVIREIGLENVIREIGLEKIIEVVDPKELLENLPVDDLAMVIKRLPPESKKKILESLS